MSCFVQNVLTQEPSEHHLNFRAFSSLEVALFTGLGSLLEPPTGLGGVFDLHDVICAVESTKCAQTGHNLSHTYLGSGAFALVRGWHVEKEVTELALIQTGLWKKTFSLLHLDQKSI